MSHAQGTHKPTEASIPLHDADSIGRGDATIGTLVKNASTHVSTLMRAEIELAKTEVTEQVKKAATGSGFFAAALVLLLTSFFPFVFMWAKLISMWFGTKTWDWMGFLIVFVVLLLLAGLFAFLGYLKIKKIRKPQRTIDSVNDLKLAMPTGADPKPGTVRVTETPEPSARR
ncbi:phage holin family protein [Dietzia aurantiaca]|uniref:phage holin family protein n=1 Tax=Dietzia aurantiaca TaxID=983873 RepID=UPI001E54EB1F|nr:phage holin family protein [Dietzia aurantiaca]MCD2262763.1 phage holin family protein [Dietzia aurantiaca]